MSEDGADVRRGAGEAQRLGYAERDPTADVEGSTPAPRRRSSPPSPSAPGSWPATSTTRASASITAADIAMRPAPRLRRQAAGHLRAGPGSGAVAVRVHPAMVPAQPPAGQRPRQLQRRVRRGRRRRLADVLRPRCRRHADGQRRARRPHRRRRQPPQGHPRLARLVRPRCRSAPSTRRRPSTTSCSTSSTGPACCTPSRASFARHGVSIRTAEQEGLGDDARLVFITHEAQEAAVQATLRELRDLDVVKRVGGFLRVIGA